MVRYAVDLSAPGVIEQEFALGFQQGVVKVLIGPNKALFEVPLKHLTKIPFFAEALKGRLHEATSKEIKLPGENHAAFAIILRWLYRGIDKGHHESTTPTIQDWTRVLLMADKWDMGKFVYEIAKHIANLCHDELKPKGPKRWNLLCDGYRAAVKHRYRFIFIHEVYVASRVCWPDQLFASMTDCPSFFMDFTRWTVIINEVQKQSTTVFTYPMADASEAQSHVTEKILMPLLFQPLKFPLELVKTLRGLCPEEGKRRGYIMNFLEM